MNYKELIQSLGDPENISDFMTDTNKLIVKINDLSKINYDSLDNINSVASIALEDNSIVLPFQGEGQIDADEIQNAIDELEEPEESVSMARQIFDKVIQTITGSITPIVPLLAGAGMGKVLLIVLDLFNLLSPESATYGILKFTFDTPFYFLPALVGFSAASVFGTNRFISAFLGLMMLHPTYTGLVDAGDPVSFLGMSLPLNSYSAQIIPAILVVWIYSYVERFSNKVVPEAVELFIAPLLSILIMTPLSLLVLAPVGMTVGEWVAQGVLWSADTFGFIAIAVMAAIYPWLVTMGLHKALSPVSIMLVSQQGFDPVVRAIALCSNIAQASVSLAVSIKAKNAELKSVARAGAITAFLGGYTEVALYGVNLKLRKPMYACMIGAASAGVYAGFVGLKAYAYITPAILSLPMWIGAAGNFFIHAIITIIISTVVTFIATWLIGFDEENYISTEEA